MDLAQMKAAVTMEGVLSGAAALELIAEVERLTEQIKAGMQPLADRMSEYAAENARLTALCDGYRGEVEELKYMCETLTEHLGNSDRHGRDNLARAITAESALTRARAEGMEEAISAAEDVPTTVSAYPTFEQARGATTAKAQIIAAIRARATKGVSDEG